MTATPTAPKLTRNQDLVLSVLASETGPLSAYAILDRLRDDGFKAPLQVYRALDKLREHHLVHRLESINAFVACSEPDCHHHGTLAFAICQNCGEVTEFSGDSVGDHLATWAADHDFRPRHSVIELTGLCSDCAARQRVQS